MGVGTEIEPGGIESTTTATRGRTDGIARGLGMAAEDGDQGPLAIQGAGKDQDPTKSPRGSARDPEATNDYETMATTVEITIGEANRQIVDDERTTVKKDMLADRRYLTGWWLSSVHLRGRPAF